MTAHQALDRLEALVQMLALPERDDLRFCLDELRQRRLDPSHIDLTRQLLAALGRSDHARPDSPERVWKAALEEVRQNKAHIAAALDAEEAKWTGYWQTLGYPVKVIDNLRAVLLGTEGPPWLSGP